MAQVVFARARASIESVCLLAGTIERRAAGRVYVTHRSGFAIAKSSPSSSRSASTPRISSRKGPSTSSATAMESDENRATSKTRGWPSRRPPRVAAKDVNGNS